MGRVNSARPLTDAELAEAKALDHRFAEAMSRKDLEAAMACFWDDPNLIVVLNGTVHRGPEAVRAATKEILDQNESLRFTVREVEVTQLSSSEGVIGVGTATMEGKPPGGPRMTTVERWSDLRRKIGGRWVYVLDHTTAVPE